MMNPNLRTYFSKFLLGSALMTVFAAIALAQDPASSNATATAQRTDGQVEMDVVHALDAAPELKNDMITAATIQGEVSLSGTSASEANRKLAESIAAKVPGVSKVNNNLKVGDPQVAQEDAGAGDGAEQSASQPQPIENQAQQPQAAGQLSANQPPAYAPQQAYSQQPDPARPQYTPTQPVAPATPAKPVTIPEGTLLRVRTAEALDTKRAKDGALVEFDVARDVYAGGALALPHGAIVHGVVTEVKKAGALGGSPMMAFKLTSIDLGGTSYPVTSDEYQVKGPNKAGSTVGNAFGGALLGAIIGGAVGGGGGAAVGAGVGAVGGTAASAATPGPRVWIPAEALMDFHLTAPVTVTPVSAQEAQRLAAASQPHPPTLYRRGPYPYGAYPPPPPPGYYYRPY